MGRGVGKWVFLCLQEERVGGLEERVRRSAGGKERDWVGVQVKTEDQDNVPEREQAARLPVPRVVPRVLTCLVQSS